MVETRAPETVLTRLERIAKLAKDKPGVALTTLAHHIDMEWLREAYRRTRKDGAKGVDGQSAEQYAERLEENLASLLDRAKSGTYRAPPPVRRVHMARREMGQEQTTHRHPYASRTRYCSAQWPWFWRLCTRRSFTTSRTASGRAARRITRARHSRAGW